MTPYSMPAVYNASTRHTESGFSLAPPNHLLPWKPGIKGHSVAGSDLFSDVRDVVTNSESAGEQRPPKSATRPNRFVVISDWNVVPM